MNANGRRRVVITGLGAVTPLGNDVRSNWEQLVAGRGAARPIKAFDTTGFAVTFACEAKDFVAVIGGLLFAYDKCVCNCAHCRRARPSWQMRLQLTNPN